MSKEKIELTGGKIYLLNLGYGSATSKYFSGTSVTYVHTEKINDRDWAVFYDNHNSLRDHLNYGEEMIRIRVPHDALTQVRDGLIVARKGSAVQKLVLAGREHPKSVQKFLDTAVAHRQAELEASPTLRLFELMADVASSRFD